MPKIMSMDRRLCIYGGEADNWHGQPLYRAIVCKVKEFDMAGASVFRGGARGQRRPQAAQEVILAAVSGN
jgi:PII-like signaling protein